jgi:hypothetical protein
MQHVKRGVYSVVNLYASKPSCVVVRTALPGEALLQKTGFLWDIPEEPEKVL